MLNHSVSYGSVDRRRYRASTMRHLRSARPACGRCPIADGFLMLLNGDRRRSVEFPVKTQT
jgi:hypothetical protein